MREKITEGVTLSPRDQVLTSLTKQRGLKIAAESNDQAMNHRSGGIQDTTTVRVVPTLWNRLLGKTPQPSFEGIPHVNQMPREDMPYTEYRIHEPIDDGHKITNVLVYSRKADIPH